MIYFTSPFEAPPHSHDGLRFLWRQAVLAESQKASPKVEGTEPPFGNVKGESTSCSFPTYAHTHSRVPSTCLLLAVTRISGAFLPAGSFLHCSFRSYHVANTVFSFESPYTRTEQTSLLSKLRGYPPLPKPPTRHLARSFTPLFRGSRRLNRLRRDACLYGGPDGETAGDGCRTG